MTAFSKCVSSAVRSSGTAAVLTQMGAQVTKRVYPGMGHTINDDELSHVQQMVNELS